MKLYILIALLFLFANLDGQNTKLLISQNGIGPINIGMSKTEVENATGSKLKALVIPDQSIKSKDSATNYICSYNGFDFLLSFFKTGSTYKIETIAPLPPSRFIETKDGIRITAKMTEVKEICKLKKYSLSEGEAVKNNTRYLLSENNSNSQSAIQIMANNGIVMSLSVIKTGN